MSKYVIWVSQVVSLLLAWLKCSLQFVRFHKRSYDSEPSALHRSTFTPATELCGTSLASHRRIVGVNEGLQGNPVDSGSASAEGFAR